MNILNETPRTDEFRHDMWDTAFFAVDRLTREDAENITRDIEWVFDNLARPLERENTKMRELLSDVLLSTVNAGTYPDGPCLDKELRNEIKTFLANHD